MAFAALALSVLVAGAGAPSIRGRVVDADGAPAAGVRVVLGEFGHATVYYNSPKQTFVATPGVPDAEHARYAAELATDAEGRFVAEGLAAGEFSIVASDERRGIGLGNARVPTDGTASVEVALALPASIDADVAGLPFDASRDMVELVPVSNGSNIQFNPHLEPIQGEWGIRSASLPALSGWRVVGTEIVFGQDYRATLFALPVQAETGQRRRVVLDTGQGVELAGSVTGADGKPLAGVSVVARELGDAPRELGAVTDAAGKYTIRGLASGKHVLEASRWKMRDLPGCGNGAQDVALSREIVVPLADAKEADLRIDGLLVAPKVGDPAPPFDARTLAGAALASRDLRGKVVLLDFWATWCPSCRVELPHLIGAYDALARDGRFEIVGVSVDTDAELVPRFVASRGVRWPQTALGPAARNPIARLFNVNSTPSTVLVDAEGRIAALNLLGEPLRRKIEELLARK
ncbi:MAG TPA: carboxypeptidase regulatory-like domain-containing protein [Planctomycetota bacterium]|jgi:thiol-disulfide isomerase/thioredoxin|nr:carboxypeptidase regulatory-like domain-containing protein [Planctomycetota bacterium]